MNPDLWMDNARLRRKAARLLVDAGYHGEALARLYYAAHAASRSLIVTKGESPATHDSVHNRLGYYFRDRLDTAMVPSLFQERLNYDYRLVHPNAQHAERWLRRVSDIIDDAGKLI